MTSSEMMGKIWADQPRMTVWPRSTTFERPLRSASIWASMPVVSTPMSALTTKMPPIVTASMAKRKPHEP